MRRCGRQNGLGLAEAAVDLFKPPQEARHGAGADGDVVADRNVAVAKLSGNHPDFLLGGRVLDPQEFGGQALAEAAVNFADGVRGDGATLEAAVVDPLLDCDMRPGFELEVALLGILAVLAAQGALDVDWVGVVPLDQVTVVAVHRADEPGQGSQQALGQGAAETGAPLRQLQGEIGQARAMARVFADEQRLHQRDRFIPVFRRFYVRFNVRFIIGHVSLYIM